MDPDEALGVVADLDVDGPERRWLRAVDECMSILDVNEEVVKVVSESGQTYLVHPTAAWCRCPDHEQRGVECKHLRRVKAERGLAGDDVEQVREGLVDLEAAVDAEVIRLQDRIDELQAARRTFRRIDDQLAELTPATDPPGFTGPNQYRDI